MTDASNVPPLPPAAEPKWWETPFWKRVTRIVTIVVGVVLGAVGLLRLYNFFVPSMPNCSASATQGVIRDIFKQRDLTLTDLSDMKMVDETPTERNCQAHIETAQEAATISYRITLQGKQFQVLITKVDAAPRKPS